MLAGNGRSKLLDLNNMRTNFVNTVYARVYTNEERLHARNPTCICIDTDECTRAREYLLAILQEPILPRNLYFSLSLVCVCVCVCVSVGTISCGKVNVCGTPAAEARNISSWKIACFSSFLDYLFAKANKSETNLENGLIKSLKTSKQHPPS